MLRRPAVLPDDRVTHRLSTAAVPYNRGLALVGDADGRDVFRVDAKTCHCLKTGHDSGRPKIRGVMFDPPGAGQVLSKFLLLYGRHLVMLDRRELRDWTSCPDRLRGRSSRLSTRTDLSRRTIYSRRLFAAGSTCAAARTAGRPKGRMRLTTMAATIHRWNHGPGGEHEQDHHGGRGTDRADRPR